MRDVESGKDLADELEWVKFSGCMWSVDSKGFFYTKFDAPKDETTETAGMGTQKLSAPKQMYHRVGTKQSEDVLIYEDAEHPELKQHLGLTYDDHYMIMGTINGTARENRLSFADLTDPKNAALNGKIEFKPLVDDFRGSFSYIQNEGTRFFFDTTYKAPRSRVIAIDLEKPAEENWVEIIPEPEDGANSEGFRLFNNHTVVQSFLKDVASAVTVWDLPTKKNGLEKAQKIGDMPLPGVGSISMMTGRFNETNLYYSFSSLNNPGDMYYVDLKDKSFSSRKIRAVDIPDYNDEDYIVDRIFYPSKDGTKVPMFVVRHKDVLPTLDSKPAKPIPTLLYGYGGFGVTNEMTFSTSRKIWMKNYGGMFAAVSMRGGGEYGEEWHE